MIVPPSTSKPTKVRSQIKEIPNAKNISTELVDDSKSKDIHACLDQLKPSTVAEWDAKWHKRVSDFISSNDFFWDSKNHRSFDPRIIPLILGKYKGNWQVSNNLNLKVEFSAEIKSENIGVTQLQMFKKSNSSEKGTTSSCSRDFNPSEDLGFDDTKNAINMFWYNCSPGLLGTAYSQFAFKVPTGMQKRQRSRVEVFGLDENFQWISVGILDLEKI